MGGSIRCAYVISSALFACLLAGCTTAPHQMLYVAPDLLPEPKARASTIFTEQELVIAPVIGVGSSGARVVGGAMGVPGTAQIWSQTFHEALFRSLSDSHLFADVRRDGKARCVLRADILNQAVTGYSGSFVVRYTLSDDQGRRDVWTQQIATDYTFPTTALAFVAPYNTQLRALMRAGAANIAMLLDRLSALPTRSLSNVMTP
jgi:hypothetical protein